MRIGGDTSDEGESEEDKDRKAGRRSSGNGDDSADTLEIFVGSYGPEAGNAMLRYLPRGGFYITGGFAPKNLDYFTKKDIFLDSLFDKGRVSPALRACPIYLVLTEELGEQGDHFYTFPLLHRALR
ncbi:hypothetical protein PsorP6_003721 [Peronosclerospora sorghi]|uniref:Uncharacterized protein n=1 Tax=Peronosclerospora sorghi TaxID=230839 RepID=A0ACC0VQL1_9STRA|nr:hypothetical protein PsorP6_003721 [Peronosclerospora sorghi]